DDSQLRFEIKNTLLDDQKKIMANTKVNLINKDGKVIQSTTTDAEGNFAFSNLPADVTYFVAVDETDPRLGKMNKLYLADSKHNVIRELNLKNGFKYGILAADEKSMGNISVYDPWIEALNLKKQAKKDSMFIIENVYYDYQDYKILPAAARVLDKVVSVMKANPEVLIELDAYTDSRGTTEFNLDLSQKRAAAAVDYMVKHGADKKKLTGKGFGKAHQLNNCGDPGVVCTEDQYAVNRRTEFKITKAVKK
ncbi:MAG TPA: OmpA family protein, partial [Bacteroidia bacterium]|nr:OmpA family protein [Bacteroidia bacterium]